MDAWIVRTRLGVIGMAEKVYVRKIEARVVMTRQGVCG